MVAFYQKYIDKENEIYGELTWGKPTSGALDPPALEAGIDWLCQDAQAILDFGCGSGCLLFACAFRGIKRMLGIDFAKEAINMARRSGAELPQCEFELGSVERLVKQANASFDGVILFNILDNLRPEDSIAVLEETVRLLCPSGKALIKLNPYLTKEQIQSWGVKTIEGDLLDDGLLLWNRKTSEWEALLNGYFRSVRLEDVYFPEYDQHNRMFLCQYPKKSN